MKFESFTYQPHELAAQFTQCTHQTLYWLYRNNYLSEQDYIDLESRLIVTPVKNEPFWGKRLLARFFDKNAGPDAYQFPIASLLKVKNESETKTTSPE